MDNNGAFFALTQGEFVPAPHAHSPWATDMLHGRLLGGLAARALEAEHGEEGLRFARLTVDLFRNTPLLPIAVETVKVREGRRIRVADAVLSTAQGPVARASAVLLREGEQPPGETLPTKQWDAPVPDGPPVTQGLRLPFDLWQLTAWGVDPGPHRAWVREAFPLVEGEEVTPFTHAALAADFASPLSNVGTAGLHFINADYTLTLSRLPRSRELGMEASGHLSADGIALGQCVMHDTMGPIGYCVVTAVANTATRALR
ncbi:acyl-CoA thioesterase domain-containing protein [Nonomuraea sp. NPDC059194]|uniref:acyl-CoA thioesterase domain-containing protein n=1 Tax=Nonomuraea sp. NPDC059194 TaxID=3346764 RepID=UPI0036BA0F66